jgi:hypothetical protein
MAEADFQHLQYQFAAHLRDPANNPAPPGIEKRRTDLYCELAITNARNFISDSFPVLHKLYDEESWTGLARDFFSTHRSRTPLFSRLAAEFLDYLANERQSAQDPPFLWELAHYEWMESALRLEDREGTPADLDADGDLLQATPVLSPFARPLAYRFPVHRISPEFRPVEVPLEPTYLVIYRNDQDDVGFMELNSVSARLMQLLGEEPMESGETLIRQVATELNHPNPDIVVQGGYDLLKQWRDRQIVLGTRRPLEAPR